ncbi:26S proteasome non-atpase regulatory [Musa troglodytarum]|uniref:26S proteasome non-atpase regulatory n=1 Tax=Musa troglodytarum TaxID=320322 RepID=A0A9E7JP30_9LILI|nr:26S proteasome non-atpase regulatory [Musa troglodytarum]
MLSLYKKETENPSGITLFSVPAQWKLSTTAVAVGLALQSHGGLGLNPKSTILKPLIGGGCLTTSLNSVLSDRVPTNEIAPSEQ